MKKGKKNISYYFYGLIDKVGRKVFPRYKRKWITLFRYTNALGDALFLTTLAREIRKRNPGAVIHVISGLPEIFRRNPDIDLVSGYNGDPIPGLGKHLVRYEHRFPWKQHLLKECALCVDIHDDIELKTYIYPSPEDVQWAEELVAQIGGSPVLINRSAGPRTDKKNWPGSYWNELVPAILKNHPVIEIGVQSLEPLNTGKGNFRDLTGKTTLHQTAALMAKSKLLVCPVTGVLHLAAAFDLPVVCILGGSEPALATKYKHTYHLENRPPCSNCYEKGPCTNNFICLAEILPDRVESKINELLSR